VVWDTERPDAVDVHLHPLDVPGALVAVDTMNPTDSWRWGGPEWPLPEDFVWYESRINDAIAKLSVVVVCAYDLFEMPGPGLILAGLQCHPSIVSDVLGERNELFEPHVRNLQTRMVNFPWLTQVEPI